MNDQFELIKKMFEIKLSVLEYGVVPKDPNAKKEEKDDHGHGHH